VVGPCPIAPPFRVGHGSVVRWAIDAAMRSLRFLARFMVGAVEAAMASRFNLALYVNRLVGDCAIEMVAWHPNSEALSSRACFNLYSFFLPGESFSPEFTDILHEASYACVSVVLFFFSTQIS
jgi:hypothetical protein